MNTIDDIPIAKLTRYASHIGAATLRDLIATSLPIKVATSLSDLDEDESCARKCDARKSGIVAALNMLPGSLTLNLRAAGPEHWTVCAFGYGDTDTAFAVAEIDGAIITFLTRRADPIGSVDVLPIAILHQTHTFCSVAEGNLRATVEALFAEE